MGSRRAAPAKALSLPVMMIAPMLSMRSNALVAWFTSSMSASQSALSALGRSRVTRPTLPRVSTLIILYAAHWRMHVKCGGLAQQSVPVIPLLVVHACIHARNAYVYATYPGQHRTPFPAPPPRGQIRSTLDETCLRLTHTSMWSRDGAALGSFLVRSPSKRSAGVCVLDWIAGPLCHAAVAGACQWSGINEWSVSGKAVMVLCTRRWTPGRTYSSP